MSSLGRSIPEPAAVGERTAEAPAPEVRASSPVPPPHLLPCLSPAPPPRRPVPPSRTKPQCANFPEATSPRCLLLMVMSSPHPSPCLSRPPQSLLPSERNVQCRERACKQQGLTQPQSLGCSHFPCTGSVGPGPAACCSPQAPAGPTLQPRARMHPLNHPPTPHHPGSRSQPWLGHRLQCHRMTEPPWVLASCSPAVTTPPPFPWVETASEPPGEAPTLRLFLQLQGWALSL